MEEQKNSTTNENQENNQGKGGETVVINNNSNSGNGLGTAGFTLALLSLFLGWIPIFGFIMWLLGLTFSTIGMFNSPRGLAIAGFVISLIWLIIFMFIGSMIFSGM